MRTKALREQRAAIGKKMQALADVMTAESRDLNAEETASFNAMAAERKTLEARIKTIEEAYTADALDTPPEAKEFRPGHHDIDPRRTNADRRAATDEQRAIALGAWMGNGRSHGLTDEQREACELTGIRPDAKELSIRVGSTQATRAAQRAIRGGGRNGGDSADRAREAYHAALTNEFPATGGLLTAPGRLASSLEVNMLAFGGLLQACDTMTTDTAEVISWPTANDTGNSGRRVAVNATANATPDPAFSECRWGAHEYTSDAILVPYRLIRDAVFDLPRILGDMLGERLGRILNSECTTGTGNSMPWGIVTKATTFSAASVSAIAVDDLIKLKKAIDPAYRSMGCSYMMHDAISLLIMLLKDGDGRPMWQDSLSQSEPDRFNGDPVQLNMAMDSTVSSGKKTVLYGHMPSYKVRRVSTIRMYHLTELYRVSGDQDAFVAFMSADGNLLDTATARMKVLTH